MDKFCERCNDSFPGTFCPKCGKFLVMKKEKVVSDKQIELADIDKEEYPNIDIEYVGNKTIVAVSKYDIKMEIYQIVDGDKITIVYERAILPSEVKYNLFILRYIVNPTERGNLLNGTKYPFPDVGGHITFVDVNDSTLRVKSELDETTWGTLRIFGMERFIRRYRPVAFNPATRAKGDRIRFCIDPTDI